MALFLLPLAGTKEKAKQKENAVEEISPSAEGDGGSAGRRPTPCKPLKRLDLNFKKAKSEDLTRNNAFLKALPRVRSLLSKRL